MYLFYDIVNQMYLEENIRFFVKVDKMLKYREYWKSEDGVWKDKKGVRFTLATGELVWTILLKCYETYEKSDQNQRVHKIIQILFVISGLPVQIRRCTLKAALTRDGEYLAKSLYH